MPSSKQFRRRKSAASLLKNISILRLVLASFAVAMCAVVLVVWPRAL